MRGNPVSGMTDREHLIGHLDEEGQTTNGDCWEPKEGEE
jgi:hypothetical protein